jgi:uncharacterized protein
MPVARINNRRDILLLLLYSPGKTAQVNEPIVGRTRLVKLLFLFKKEALPHFQRGTDINEENFYQFFAWNFGPFSTQVYDDITFFVLRGFIESSAVEEEPLPESAAEWDEWQSQSGTKQTPDEFTAYEEEKFLLTDRGLKFTRAMYDVLSPSQRQLLQEFKARLGQAPLRAILKYVYTTYPETTDKSQIKGEVLGHSR